MSQQQPQPPPSPLKSKIVAGTMGFVTGILGNLVAAIIQTDWLQNEFSTWGIAMIVGFSIIGVLFMAWLERDNGTISEPDKPVDISSNTMIKTPVKTRGKGIRMKGNFSVGSDFDIDTREQSNPNE